MSSLAEIICAAGYSTLAEYVCNPPAGETKYIPVNELTGDLDPSVIDGDLTIVTISGDMEAPQFGGEVLSSPIGGEPLDSNVEGDIR